MARLCAMNGGTFIYEDVLDGPNRKNNNYYSDM
jgi:hypothetical protein